jgi:plasmid stabilization system protein ParE
MSRRLLVGDTGYQLFYRLVGDGIVLILSIRHEKQRPPKL